MDNVIKTKNNFLLIIIFSLLIFITPSYANLPLPPFSGSGGGVVYAMKGIKYTKQRNASNSNIETTTSYDETKARNGSDFSKRKFYTAKYDKNY